MLALSFNPEVILLDEPTSGLDPRARRDFIENIVGEIAQFGRTVIFSTHIVEEVERVADYVAILHCGRLLSVARVEEIKASYKKIRLDHTQPVPKSLNLVSIEIREKEKVLTVKDWNEETVRHLSCEQMPMTLEEIFVDTVRSSDGDKR
ncbi:AAA family ATPase [bacterium]|nr:AAA family ATPase [bacterium]